MPNKTRNTNRKKQLKNKRKSRRQNQKKSEVRDVRKKHMQKIKFGAVVMFGKKYGQVASNVSKMLVGP